MPFLYLQLYHLLTTNETLIWGEVNIVTPGVVSIKVQNEKVDLLYNKNVFTAKIETIKLDDTKFSQVWGKQIYRLSLNAKELKMSGKYSYTIQKAE